MLAINALAFCLDDTDRNEISLAIDVLGAYETALRDNDYNTAGNALHEARCTLIRIRDNGFIGNVDDD